MLNLFQFSITVAWLETLFFAKLQIKKIKTFLNLKKAKCDKKILIGRKSFWGAFYPLSVK